jgi:hypothetical protein
MATVRSGVALSTHDVSKIRRAMEAVKKKSVAVRSTLFDAAAAGNIENVVRLLSKLFLFIFCPFQFHIRIILRIFAHAFAEKNMQYTPDHLLLDSAPNFGPLISRWEINKLENC